MAGRRRFENCRVLSVAMDAASIGKKRVFSVALVDPQNAGMYAPPQAAAFAIENLGGTSDFRRAIRQLLAAPVGCR